MCICVPILGACYVINVEVVFFLLLMLKYWKRLLLAVSFWSKWVVSSLSAELWEGIGAAKNKKNIITLIAHSSFLVFEEKGIEEFLRFMYLTFLEYVMFDLGSRPYVFYLKVILSLTMRILGTC